MKPCWTALGSVVMTLAISGCGDSGSAAGGKKPPEAPQQQGAGNPLTAPVDYLGAVGAAQRQAAKTVDLTSLSQAVQAFQAGEERLPRSLQELVTEGYLPRIPAPPRGMQWAYQAQSGQVRAVPVAVAPPAPAPTAPQRR